MPVWPTDPLFQGLRSVWAQDGDLLVEAALPEEVAADASAYGLHPALLDTVLHALGLQNPDAESAMLPFLWSGVSLSAVGAPAVRARLSPRGTGEYGLRLADAAGQPVAEIDSLVLRPVSAADLARAGSAPTDGLFRLDWVSAPAPAEPGEPGDWAVLGTDAQTEDGWRAAGVAATGYQDVGALTAAVAGGAARSRARWSCRWWRILVISLVGLLVCWRRCGRGWLRSVWRIRAWWWSTTGAVALDAAADASELDLASAGVWGLVRSAISEHPGRFVLADVDGERDSYRAVAAYAAESGESQFAVREGRIRLPRVVRMAIPARDEDVPATRWDKGTVLVTGGTGGLGAVVARHLVTAHGVRDLLLLSRRGVGAPGAEELRDELTGLGARVTITACDVSRSRGAGRCAGRGPRGCTPDGQSCTPPVSWTTE